MPETVSIELGRREVARALEDAGMWSFPRMAGPSQRPLYGPSPFYQWWDNYHGMEGGLEPMFLAHNAHVPPPVQRGDPWEYDFEAAFGDLDNGNRSGLEAIEVCEEARRLEHRLEEWGLEHYWKVSGSRGLYEGDGDWLPAGFHVRVFFQPERRPKNYLSRWENAFWRGVKNDLSLRSVNIQCAEPKRLERVPFSRYVSAKPPPGTPVPERPPVPGQRMVYYPTDNYCVPVPYELVRDGRFRELYELSVYPALAVRETVRFRAEGERPILEAFVRKHGWETFGHVRSALHPEPAVRPSGPVADVVPFYFPDRLCLQVLPFGSNPKHTVRTALLFQLVDPNGIRMGFEEAASFIESIGREARWEDYNETVIEGFVRQAISAGYHAYSCDKIREGGACLGAKCPRFASEFPSEARLSPPEVPVSKEEPS